MTPLETLDNEISDAHAAWLHHVWLLDTAAARLDDAAIDELLERRFRLTAERDASDWPE